MSRVAVVGGGLGGLRVCESLRQSGFDGDIVLLGDEHHPPYSRPPLSKEVLRGADSSVAALRTPDELADLDIDLRLGVAAASLDVTDRRIALADGSSVEYDQVVLATGATPRRLPGVALDGVVTLRTLDDCLRLRSQLTAGARIVIVGAGFIGLEVAASARALDCAVTVADIVATPLDRVLDPELGRAVQSLHDANGVSFRLGVGVETLIGDDAVSAVRLADGSSIDADVVVVGIGVVPETRWLETSGLKLSDGVMVDSSLAAAENVWAIGDLARWSHPAYPSGVRLEHWTNTGEQALHVAQSIVSGSAAPFESVPYFWSDQYDAKLQSLGFLAKGDEMRVVIGSLDEPKWTALIRSGDRLGGVVGLRSARHVMKARPLLAAGTSWGDAVAAYS